MIKIERNPIPPSSLIIESQKPNGVYNKPDVIQRLKEDSNDKCYICELGGLSDPEVEHIMDVNFQRECLIGTIYFMYVHIVII